MSRYGCSRARARNLSFSAMSWRELNREKRYSHSSYNGAKNASAGREFRLHTFLFRPDGERPSRRACRSDRFVHRLAISARRLPTVADITSYRDLGPAVPLIERVKLLIDIWVIPMTADGMYYILNSSLKSRSFNAGNGGDGTFHRLIPLSLGIKRLSFAPKKHAHNLCAPMYASGYQR